MASSRRRLVEERTCPASYRSAALLRSGPAQSARLLSHNYGTVTLTTFAVWKAPVATLRVETTRS